MPHGAAESTTRPRVQKTHTEPPPHSDACYRPPPSSGARPSRRTRRRRDGVFFAHVSCRRAMGYANELDPSQRHVQLGCVERPVAGVSAVCTAHGAPAAPASNEQRKRGLNVRVLAALGALSLAALAPSPRDRRGCASRRRRSTLARPLTRRCTAAHAVGGAHRAGSAAPWSKCS